jgi:hypothetical protein
VLASRLPPPDLTPDAALPDDTRLWAALQQAGGGTWGGCVYDVDAILALLEAGESHCSEIDGCSPGSYDPSCDCQ